MKIKNIKKKRKRNDEKSEVDEVRESVSEIVLLDEDANRERNCAHQKSTHCLCEGDKRVVLAGRRVLKQTI